MEPKSCRVAITDHAGVEHSVTVTAGTLYEAIALALRSVRRSDWIDGIPERLVATVTVNSVPVEHLVKIGDFLKWLERSGGKSPAEVIQRKRIREILGLP